MVGHITDEEAEAYGGPVTLLTPHRCSVQRSEYSQSISKLSLLPHTGHQELVCRSLLTMVKGRKGRCKVCDSRQMTPVHRLSYRMVLEAKPAIDA